MKKQKRELLNNTFNSFIEVGLSGENLEILEDIVFKDVVGFGTTVDEKLFGVKELRDLLIRQKEQSAGMALSWKINTLDLYISSDENTAIFTNEITLYLIVDDNPVEIYLRFSIVMEYADDKWMVVHWHGSKPEHVESEKDTWGVQTWKEKAEELENLVAERTADLVVKNRELEIETALERIRAQAVAMKESTDLLDIVVTMRNEFIKLGHEAQYFWHMMWLPETYEKAMTSGDGSKIGFVMQLPRHIHGNIPQLAKWEKSTKPTVVYTMTVDEAIDYVDKMVSLGDFKNIDPQAPSHDDIRHIGGLTFIMARTTHGEIGYSLPGVVENPPKADIDILVKYASAFDLAHQRFLDLQKAETQARETQIELALEKIRSRSMAMHKSDEL
ncbi:nuclear transport factor 2 family protein, partial [Paucihalobacter sp.]|uniref:nuclear transport factor 2 family protein n=1 Tax=Paucihalobacter sp. TaxID=2850405 RepID=UPI003D161175